MKGDWRTFDDFAEDYDFRASLERRHDFFVENLPQGRSRALDIGCGTGHLALELSKHYESVLAIDISGSMLDIARRRRSAPNLEYRCMDANELELAEEFDLIVSHTTFHHLQRSGRYLQS